MNQELETQQRRAYQMRLGGQSVSDIAVALNVTAKEVNDMVRRERRGIQQFVTEEERKDLADLEASRLDALLAAYWNSALTGDVKDAEFVLKVISQRIKLNRLDQTLDADQTKAVLITGASKEEFLEILRVAQEQPTDILEGEVVEEEE